MEFHETRLEGKRLFRLDGTTLSIENRDLASRPLSRDSLDLAILAPGARRIEFRHVQHRAMTTRVHQSTIALVVLPVSAVALDLPVAAVVVAVAVPSFFLAGFMFAARHFSAMQHAAAWRTHADLHGLDVVREPGNEEAFESFVSAVDHAVRAANTERGAP